MKDAKDSLRILRHLVLIDVPDWAHYIAQDNSGEWHAFEKKPFYNRMYDRWDCKKGNKAYIYSGMVAIPEKSLEVVKKL